MSVSGDEVLWAYRMLLGREPENEAAVEHHMTWTDRAALREAFMISSEYQQANRPGKAPLIGTFLDAKTISVEVDCSSEQRSIMIDHIAAEWRKLGEEVPHWSVLTGEQFKPENIAANMDSFYASGVNHAATMLNPLSRSGLQTTRFERVMDFGCGVGRLTLAMAPIAGAIMGVDISPPHIALAQERAKNLTNVSFASISSVHEISILGKFDLIFSFIVLQHNPPPVMADILRQLLTCLAPGGCIIVQIPTYIDGYKFIVDRYIKNPNAGISANMLPQQKIFEIFLRAECDVLEVRQDGFLGEALSHTFAARKR